MIESLHGEKSPVLVRFSGLPGVGKTTLAEELSSQLGIPYVDVDNKRKELFGLNPVLPPKIEKLQMKAAYNAMYIEAGLLLRENPLVAIGATFRSRESRAIASQFANNVGARLFPVALVFFDEEIEERIIKERMVERNKQGSYSNIRSYEEYLRVKAGAVPYDDPDTLLLDAAKPTSVLMSEFMKALQR